MDEVENVEEIQCEGEKLVSFYARRKENFVLLAKEKKWLMVNLKKKFAEKEKP